MIAYNSDKVYNKNDKCGMWIGKCQQADSYPAPRNDKYWGAHTLWKKNNFVLQTAASK